MVKNFNTNYILRNHYTQTTIYFFVRINLCATLYVYNVYIIKKVYGLSK